MAAPTTVEVDTETAVNIAQAAFVAGLLHSALRQTGWTIHEAAAAEGRCTVGCAALFGPGVVADVVVTIRKVDEL